ncbi:MAG: hypothetical protein AB9903_09045 [Vulcanimicrobiota bacterium]
MSSNVLEKELCDAELIEVDEPDRPASDLHEGEEKAESDGHKCQRTGCGATEEKNLCKACAFCYDLVHKGRLSLEGEAPHQLI